MGKKTSEEAAETAPWGIVSIKAQDVDYEIPMTPITAFRNALGKDEGGSGVPLDRDAYLEAYKFWNTRKFRNNFPCMVIDMYRADVFLLFYKRLPS